MIVKYPIILFLFIPLILLFFYLRNTNTKHTIRFPKASWMTHLKSNKAIKLYKFTYLLEILIFVLLVVSIAQPQMVKAERYQTKKGIDIVAILDTSGSMNAEDFEPKNRMEVAKENLVKFMKARTSDRLGLIIFGTDAITKAPITFDHNIVKFHIEQTQVGDAGDGTAIGLAIATGVNRLQNSKAQSRIIILITDGVNNAGQIDPISAAKLAANKGIKIYSIGIGDKKGAPIPIPHDTYGKRYARHPNGQLILTEFDDTVLKEVSKITKGAYFNATDASELKEVYKQINELEKTIIQTNRNFITMEMFPYLIASILILFLLKELIILKSLIGVRT